MKKIIFGIFAHPDDEAFGPSGALLLETKTGSELHLITLTNGSAGTNPDNATNLGEVRLKEWQAAGQLLGATSMHHLGFEDGQLNNQAMLEASQKIEHIITKIANGHAEPVEIEFMTIDLNGLTGHIDHIVAARAACFVFYRLKTQDKRYKRIRLSCLSRKQLPAVNTDWLFMEPGRAPQEIDQTIDAQPLREEIIGVVKAHHSQRGDGEAMLRSQNDSLGLCHFIIKS